MEGPWNFNSWAIFTKSWTERSKPKTKRRVSAFFGGFVFFFDVVAFFLEDFLFGVLRSDFFLGGAFKGKEGGPTGWF